MVEELEKLYRLMQENPTLPVIPVVDADEFSHDGYYSWRLGDWGGVEIQTYCMVGGEMRFFDPSDADEISDTLSALVESGRLGIEVWPELENAERAEELYRSVPNWKTAIIVYIWRR